MDPMMHLIDTHGFIRHEPIPVEIYADPPAEHAGNASHFYRLCDKDGNVFAEIQYFRGPRNAPDQIPGIADIHLLAVARDRLLGFQAGPFKSRENALALTAIEEAIMWLTRRADERYARGVLGENKV